MSHSLTSLLAQTFGFDQFRLGQEQVVGTILSGQSAAAIFPTGSGKSLCYQLPATQLPHLTLVVSPLLALMQDQLSFLASKGINAASIDSSQTKEQSQQVMQGVRQGSIKILMISVERFNNERFRQFLGQVPISLLVVDEAHCISEWGHNFRPDYLKLPQYQQQFNIPQALLLTATATEKVISDMAEKFAISQENITTTGFYRNNLNLEVIGVASESKLNTLVNWLRGRKQQAGIVYVTLQQTAEQVASQLSQQGFPAQAYHAGMNPEQRETIQRGFMSGATQLIVATIAFGMGIDKSDIRYVAHFDLPKSIENYAQEIGRAGRDNLPSDCLVLANQDNLHVLENFVYGDTPEQQAIEFVLSEISQAQGDFELVINSLSSAANIKQLTLKTLLVYLELYGVIEPAYSYFAEYKFKLFVSESELLNRFQGERKSFVQALLNSSDKAKIWYAINFEQLNQNYPSDRERVLAALEYFDEQQLIELQAKQMTQVYHVVNRNFNREQLAQQLSQRFNEKEQSEVARIHNLLTFFTTNQCLSKQLAQYFADHQLQENCGHCSVCAGRIAQLPAMPELKPLEQLDLADLSAPARQKLEHHATPTILARFFCGLTTPIFTKLRMRQVSGFAMLEQYPFAQVRAQLELITK